MIVGKIKSKTSLVGAALFLCIALYIFIQYDLNVQVGLASMIMSYFLVAAFLGVESQTIMIFRILMMSVVLLYVISLYI